MTNAEEREQVRQHLLGVAGQAERLLRTDPADTTYDPDALARYRNLYGDQLREIVQWRDESLATPAKWSSTELTAKVEQAQKVLGLWTNPARAAASTEQPRVEE